MERRRANIESEANGKSGDGGGVRRGNILEKRGMEEGGGKERNGEWE
jgi:hypothetical protein